MVRLDKQVFVDKMKTTFECSDEEKYFYWWIENESMSSSEEEDPMAQHYVECELCETNPAQHFCNTCPGALCDICKEDHKRKKIFQNHEVIPLVSSLKQTTSFCTDHRTKRCDLYCRQCNQPVCSECVTEKHKGHLMEKLSSYLEELRGWLTQYADRIGKIVIPAHENLMRETKTSHAEVIKSAEEVSISVKKQTKNIIHAVKSAESDILDVLEESKNHALRSIQSDQSLLGDSINRLNKIKQTTEQILNSNSEDVTLLQEQKSNIKEMEKTTELETETLPETTVVTLSKFVAGKLDMSLLKRQIGNLTSFGQSKKERWRVDGSSHPPRLVRSERKLMKKPTRKTEVKVDVEKQWEIRCINTNTAVVWGKDNKIRIVDISGKVTTITTSLPLGHCPMGMDLTKDNDIIYTDRINRKVMRVSMTGDISTLLTLRTDYIPRGLSVTRTGSILMSLALKADRDDEGQRGKVVEYTTSGQVVREFITDGGRELFKLPACVVNNPVNDDIMVSDYVLHKVIVLNGMGGLRFEYNGKALSKSDKFWPRQITCDSLCQILIADQYSSAIHVISQNGHPLTLLLTGELDIPMGVCFDGVDSIWIAEWKSKKIKIYKYLE